jgi:hypothetical protein
MENPDFQQLVRYLQKSDPEDTHAEQRKTAKHYSVNNGILYFYAKEGQALRRVIRAHELPTILYQFHSSPYGAHQGAATMYQKTYSRFFWPTMKRDIRRYVKTCDACQRIGKARPNRPMNPLPIPQSPFDTIEMDYIGPLPESYEGYRYIWVAIDYLTKWPEARSAQVATAAMTAQFLYEDIICRHGCPKTIISDNGTHFDNEEVATLLRDYGIEQRFSTPYHPQTNGLVERMNGTIKRALTKLSANRKGQWNQCLPAVLLAIRSSVQSSTKFTPFMLTYGREAKLPADCESNGSHMERPRETDILNRSYQLIELQEDRLRRAREYLKKAQARQKKRYDEGISLYLIPLEIGDKVLLHDPTKTGPLQQQWKGPYYVHDVRPNNTYKLRELGGQVLKKPVNAARIRLYHENSSNLSHNIFTPPQLSQ